MTLREQSRRRLANQRRDRGEGGAEPRRVIALGHRLQDILEDRSTSKITVEADQNSQEIEADQNSLSYCGRWRDLGEGGA